jgi:hypothetical protein
LQASVREDLDSEAQDDGSEVKAIELCEGTHSQDFSECDGVEIRTEPIPPDKNIISLHSEPLIPSKYMFDSQLNDIPLQYSPMDTRGHYSAETCTKPVPPHKSVTSFDSDPSIFFSEYGVD